MYTQHHQAVGKVWAEIARHLSDTMIIPLDVVGFSTELENIINTLDKNYGGLLRRHGINFGKTVYKKSG